jgi:hypothetical protein
MTHQIMGTHVMKIKEIPLIPLVCRYMYLPTTTKSDGLTHVGGRC